MIRKALVAVAVLFGLYIVGLIGEEDYKDAVVEQAHYCDMVNQGHWPNYRHVDCSTPHSVARR